MFSLAYWSLFKDKPKDHISPTGAPKAQQPDIVKLLDKESQKTSNKYWQGDLDQASDKA